MSYNSNRTVDRDTSGPTVEQERSSASFSRTSDPMFIRTNRVLLSTEPNNSRVLNLKIEFSLNLRQDRSSAFFEELEEVLRNPSSQRFVRRNALYDNFEIVFLVIDDSSEELLQSIYTPESRSPIIDNFENHALIAKLRNNGGVIRVPLMDALMSNRDLEGRTSVSEMGGESYYETYSEVSFEYSPSEKSSSGFLEGSAFYDSFQSSNLHLVGFFMAPRSPRISSSSTTTNDLVYDLILTRNLSLSLGAAGDANLSAQTRTGIQGSLKVPLSRSVYYVSDDREQYADVNGKPYSGPVFLSRMFAEGLPTVLRAGFLNNPGPKVSITTIRQNKVFSDNLFHFSFLPSNPLGQNFDTSLYGGPNSLSRDYFESSNLGLFGASSSNIDAARIEMASSIISKTADRPSFITANTPYFTSRIRRGESVTAQSIIGLKILDIITHNTPFKTLLANLRMSNTDLARSVLYSICSRSKLVDLSIFRRRVSNSPYDNNNQDTKLYGDFEENQEKTLLISSSDIQDPASDPITVGIQFATNDRLRRTLARQRSQPGSNRLRRPGLISLHEIRHRTHHRRERDFTRNRAFNTFLSSTDNDYFNEFNRSILINDADTARLTAGKYTYDVKITLKDATGEVIKDKLKDFENKLIGLKEYKDFISIPIIRNSSGFIVSGNYDYTNRYLRISQFSEEYKQQADEAVGTVLTMFRELVLLLTGQEVFPEITNEETRAKLSLSSRSTSPEGFEFFLKQCFDLSEKVEQFLKTTFQSSRNLISGNTGAVFVPNSTSRASNIIVEETNTGIIFDAADNLRMSADYGDSSDVSSFIQSVRSRILRDFARGHNAFPPGYSSPLDANADDETISLPRGEILLMPEELLTFESEQLVLSGLGSAPITATVLKNILNDGLSGAPERTYQSLPQGASNLPEYASPSNSSLGVRTTNSLKLQDYQLMNSAQRSIQEAKVFTMMQEGSHIYGFQDKDDSFFIRNAPSHLGTTSVSLSGFDQSSSMKGFIQSALRSSNIEIDYLTKELEASIIESIDASSTEQQFIDKAQDNFKELVNIADRLGSFYNEFNKILSDSKLTLSSRKFNLTFEDKFKKGLKESDNITQSAGTSSPFVKKSVRFVEYGQNSEYKILSSTDVEGILDSKIFDPQATKTLKTVRVIRLQQAGSKDNIRAINDVILTEVP